MLAPVRELTERRKRSLLRAHHGKNSLHETGLKPSGPSFAGYARGGKYLAESGRGVGLTAIAATLALGAMGLRRVSKAASAVVGITGLALLYRGLRDIFSPSDDMTANKIGFRNPNATLQHLEGEKIEVEIDVACSIDAAFEYCCDNPQLSIHRSDDSQHRYSFETSNGENVIPIVEIFREQPGHLVAWRTMPEAKVRAAGALRLRVVDDATTHISLFVKYDPQGFSRIIIEKSIEILKDELERANPANPAQA
jgi:uncharacterized membrane protein